MTTDDFKQKCDEIHSIVCYLLSRNVDLIQRDSIASFEGVQISKAFSGVLTDFRQACIIADKIRAKDV